jgi:hypothetical protein
MFVDTIKKNHDSNSKVKLSALESYSLQAQEFNRSLGFYLKKEEMNSVKRLIKSYFWKHPVEREMLVSLSHLFLNELGQLELAQFCSRLHIDIVNDISQFGVKYYNLPRVVEKLPAANF